MSKSDKMPKIEPRLKCMSCNTISNMHEWNASERVFGWLECPHCHEASVRMPSNFWQWSQSESKASYEEYWGQKLW